ncbi:MAG TPA: YjjG family noncanonical pyrimidine nucleotidase [Sunxiuqinia sp.]|nr:YjjG family noncanonical pyrimidine nucleotidase [Sunxiuqinia sp.]
MRKYDHLFFDLDHTLWDFETNSKLAMKEVVNQLKLKAIIDDFESFFDYYENVNAQLWEAYRNQGISKPELIKKRFKDSLEYFNIEGIDPVEMNELYLQLMPLQTKLFPGAIETLDYLKGKGYQMYIITNGFSEVQHKKIESSGLQPYFSRVFISEEIKFPKPDIRIFQHALKTCNAKKSRSIMIGDSWDSDIIGAINTGISQVAITNNGENKTLPPRKEWGMKEKGHFQKDTPQFKTYIVPNLVYLTKLF